MSVCYVNRQNWIGVYMHFSVGQQHMCGPLRGGFQLGSWKKSFIFYFWLLKFCEFFSFFWYMNESGEKIIQWYATCIATCWNEFSRGATGCNPFFHPFFFNFTNFFSWFVMKLIGFLSPLAKKIRNLTVTNIFHIYPWKIDLYHIFFIIPTKYSMYPVDFRSLGVIGKI